MLLKFLLWKQGHRGSQRWGWGTMWEAERDFSQRLAHGSVWQWALLQPGQGSPLTWLSWRRATVPPTCLWSAPDLGYLIFFLKVGIQIQLFRFLLFYLGLGGDVLFALFTLFGCGKNA